MVTSPAMSIFPANGMPTFEYTARLLMFKGLRHGLTAPGAGSHAICESYPAKCENWSVLHQTPARWMPSWNWLFKFQMRDFLRKFNERVATFPLGANRRGCARTRNLVSIERRTSLEVVFS
jgi:hypothetical protein